MTSTSVLVSSEICQRCAKCCKEFTHLFDFNDALRFKWFKDCDVKVRETGECFPDNKTEKMFEVVFKIPCVKLKQHSSGKFYCSVWGKERPNFCLSYPDHVFNWKKMSKVELEKARVEEAVNCPALGKLSVEEIISKLKLEVLV